MAATARSWIGPTAPWMSDLEEGSLQEKKQEIAHYLRDRLLTRDRVLRQLDISLEALSQEMRRQMSSAVVDGDLQTLTDLSDLLWKLVEEQGGKRRSGV